MILGVLPEHPPDVVGVDVEAAELAATGTGDPPKSVHLGIGVEPMDAPHPTRSNWS